MSVLYQLQQGMWAFSPYQILFWLSIVFILVRCRKEQRLWWFGIYACLAYGITVYSPFAALVVKYLYSDIAAYYRVFYLVPVIPLIAYTATKILDGVWEKWHLALRRDRLIRIASVIAIVGILCGLGDFSAYREMYRWPENIYKVSQEAVELSDAIKADNGGGGKVGVFLPVDIDYYNAGGDDFYFGIRQYYAGAVLSPYRIDVEEEVVLSSLRSAVVNDAIQYIVVPDTDTEAIALMESLGERLVWTGDSYVLYSK